jgi:hypothetical protein
MSIGAHGVFSRNLLCWLYIACFSDIAEQMLDIKSPFPRQYKEGAGKGGFFYPLSVITMLRSQG